MSTESPALGSPVPVAVGGATTEYPNRGWILAVMCLALVMVVAGVSMLANALPSIAADLDASQSSQQWIVDAYALTLAALLLPAGAVGDRFGRRGALIAGTAIFGVAAGLSALAGSPNELIALRALMGIGAALLMPGTLSTITSVFPPEERAKAVGIWAGFAGAGGTLGILASGALLEQFAWGSVFVLTAVLAGVACVGMILVVPTTRAEERVAFDIRGSVVSAIGIGLLVLGIIEGPERGWTDPVTLLGLVGGVAFLATFVWVELRTDEPLLDPRLFRHRGFATGSASLFLQFFAMFGFFFVSLQFLQLVLGYSTLEAALALLPMSIVLLPISAVAGTMSEKYGHRLVGGAGLAISGVGFALFAMLGTGSGFWPFVLVTIVIGVGAALAMTPATNAIVASLPRAKQGVASAVNDTARARRRVRRRRTRQRVQHRLPPRHRRRPGRLPGRRRAPGAGGARDRRRPVRADPGRRGARHRGAGGVHHRHALFGAPRGGAPGRRRPLRVVPRGLAGGGGRGGRPRRAGGRGRMT